jgi:amidase
MTELCDLNALELRALIGARQISPVELLASCRARIERVNGALNAFVATCWDRAEAEARTAEQAVMSGAALGALHGLPIGIKDLALTEGLRTTFGSPQFPDYVPDADERQVAAVRRAGAIVVGKTNTPEFGAGANTVNPVYGATGNPFDPDMTCAGSSPARTWAGRCAIPRRIAGWSASVPAPGPYRMSCAWSAGRRSACRGRWPAPSPMRRCCSA